MNADTFREGVAARLFTEVQCSGNESSILECGRTEFAGTSCPTSGVVCQGWFSMLTIAWNMIPELSLIVAIDTPIGTCSTGDVRLAQSVSTTTTTLEGRLELCINNAWGTICDELFDTNDAEVACSRLKGFSSQGNSHLYRPGGPGGIWVHVH